MYLFEELIDINERTWKYNDIDYWINPKDNTCNATIIFNGKKSRLRAGIIILKDDEILLGEEEDEPGVFSLPGGGLEEGETPIEAAIREAQEEVYINVKDAIDTKFDYCECHDDVKDWVRDNVPEEEWWYNYYTCLIIAKYDGEYKGNVAKADQDKSMKSTAKWYKIADVINATSFKEQWKRAIYFYKRLNEQIIEFGTKWFVKSDNTTDLKEYLTKADAENSVRQIEYFRYLNENAIKLPYFYSGPVYRFNKFLGNVKLKTYAVSEKQAINNFKFQAAAKFNYDRSAGAQISINTNLVQVDDFDLSLLDEPKKEKQYCEICGTLLNDLGECPVCDLGDESILDEAITKKVLKTILVEDTRAQQVNASKKAGPYKNQKYGKNRFERKRYSKVANQVKSYNKINMDQFFKKDILEITIPVTGETDSYNVVIRLEGVVAEIAKNIKSNQNKLEYRTILQSVTKIFNTTNIYTKCDCDDYKFRFAYWNIVKNVSVDDSAHNPGPGKGLANPNDDKGRGCKHILLCLANQDWLMKVSSVINNYINWMAEHKKELFNKIIFPKLYGTTINDAVEAKLVPEDTNLETTKDIIDVINQWGGGRGKIKPGSNKNPVASNAKLK